MKTAVPTCSSVPAAAARVVPWASPLPTSLCQMHASVFRGQALCAGARQAVLRVSAPAICAAATRDGAVLDRPLRVVVVGGGPSGACAAETLAQNGIDTVLLERKMNNCKVPPRVSCLRVRGRPRLCGFASRGTVPCLTAGCACAALWRRHPPLHGGRV